MFSLISFTILSLCVMLTYVFPPLQSLPHISHSSLSPFQWKHSPLVQTNMLCLRNHSLAHVVFWNGITLRWPSGRTTPLKVSLQTIIWMKRFCESLCVKKYIYIQSVFVSKQSSQVAYIILLSVVMWRWEMEWKPQWFASLLTFVFCFGLSRHFHCGL